MNTKEKVRNDILVGMQMHLDACTMAILDAIIVKAVQNVEMTEVTTLPAMVDDTNQYVLNLFDVKKAPKLSPMTVEFYKSTINEFMVLVNKPLNKVTESDIEYYLMQKKPNNTNASLNNLRRNLSAFFTWMRKEKLISENPCDGVDPYQVIEKPIDHMEVTDVEKLKLGCKYKRDRALIEFMRSTAMRRGEVPAVKISDIDFRSGKLVIFGEKTQKYRTVFLDNVAIHYIQEYLKDRGVSEGSREPLFTHLRGDKTRSLDADGVYASIKDIAARAGMDRRIYPHLFRKTTATNICKRGGSVDAAGEYLGHAPRNVTDRHYTYKGDKYVEQIFHNFVEAV
ncbi:MAG: tyrosine-type recombinase/integrase [Lachnospiraceae bacterium]|nr:tyrosine-type recombinase/integrase [Lachnospiraceae bacterium]MDE7205296.1 tyrosine-type recombinase/integrase [Lachnospiraceae bacterium]